MGHYGFCHRKHTVMTLFFLKDRSSRQYFITQGIDQSLCSLPTYVILGGRIWGLCKWVEREEEPQGYIPVYCEACLKP